MPKNKNALLRYRILDRCLRNRQRRYTLTDLRREISRELGAEDEEPLRVSRRTLQNDLATLRGGELGYHAPIEVVEQKYYRYADPDFTIRALPVSAEELAQLTEAIDVLRQVSGFEHLATIDATLDRLRRRITAENGVEKSVETASLSLNSSSSAEGSEWLPELRELLRARQVVAVDYAAFGSPEKRYDLHPYLLKLYDDRWYLVGYHQLYRKMMNLPLDRITGLTALGPERFIPNTFFDPETYYRDTIGVTVRPEVKPRLVEICLLSRLAPYVLSRPLHHSQRLKATLADGRVVITIFVRPNFELLQLLLRFSAESVVLSPGKLRNQVAGLLADSAERYGSKAWRGEVWREVEQ